MIDYKDFATRAMAVLKMYPDLGYMPNIGTVYATQDLTKEWEAAQELKDYPLPEWAKGYNIQQGLVPGAQLCTKDGRQRGNARIVSIDMDNPVFPKGTVLFKVRTDIGSEMNLLAEEINHMFYLGRYILKEGK